MLSEYDKKLDEKMIYYIEKTDVILKMISYRSNK